MSKINLWAIFYSKKPSGVLTVQQAKPYYAMH